MLRRFARSVSILFALGPIAAQQPLELPVPAPGRLAPRIEGPWWTIAHNPDLGRLTGPEQQPVDFAIWQAKDGTWQLWSCIRNTQCGGNTRLFHRWEGKRLTDTDWKPLGVAMEANPELGETAGGLQAPHVMRDGNVFQMVYGDWNRICLAQSRDGKKFERIRNERGAPDLFTGPFNTTRDPMLLKIGDFYHCYYTGDQTEGLYNAAVFCRTSLDLRRWSEPVNVSAGGSAAKFGGAGTNAECPFVVAIDDSYYLFRNIGYGPTDQNAQYASRNPLCFGVGDDLDYVGHLPVAAPEIVLFQGRYYIAALLPTLDGIRMARLEWVKN